MCVSVCAQAPAGQVGQGKEDCYVEERSDCWWHDQRCAWVALMLVQIGFRFLCGRSWHSLGAFVSQAFSSDLDYACKQSAVTQTHHIQNKFDLFIIQWDWWNWLINVFCCVRVYQYAWKLQVLLGHALDVPRPMAISTEVDTVLDLEFQTTNAKWFIECQRFISSNVFVIHLAKP